MGTKPAAPVLLTDAVCDKRGIAVKWMVGGNVVADTHTISWKAESWWQSASMTIPSSELEYRIENVPANEKINVWIYSTNAAGAGSYSNTVSFVSSRDCGVKGEADPDYESEPIPLPISAVVKIIYTPEFQKFISKRGPIGEMEVLSSDDSSLKTRIRPQVDPKLKSTISKLAGKEFDLTYEEHATVDRAAGKITFVVRNFSVFAEYIETADGEVWVEEAGEGSCIMKTNFNFRLKNVPVIGYYISQLIKSSFREGSMQMKTNLQAWTESHS